MCPNARVIYPSSRAAGTPGVRERDRHKRENEDKLVGGRGEKIGDLERKGGLVKRHRDTLAETNVCEGVWRVESLICRRVTVCDKVNVPLQHLWVLRRHDKHTHTNTLCRLL